MLIEPEGFGDGDCFSWPELLKTKGPSIGSPCLEVNHLASDKVMGDIEPSTAAMIKDR